MSMDGDEMATTLRYNLAGSTEGNGVLTVGFGDDQPETSEYLILSNWLGAEEAGEGDGVYIERDDQRYGIYGDIERFVLTRDRAAMQLSPKTAEAIRTGRGVTIISPATDEQFQKLKADLERVFAGTRSLELR